MATWIRVWHSPHGVWLFEIPIERIMAVVDYSYRRGFCVFLDPLCKITNPAVSSRPDLHLAWAVIRARSLPVPSGAKVMLIICTDLVLDLRTRLAAPAKWSFDLSLPEVDMKITICLSSYLRIFLCSGCVILFCHQSGQAQTDPFYSGKTIRVVVGFTPGGFYDRWARL